MAGPKITLLFMRLFVCLCVRIYHMHNILRHTFTMQLQYIAAFGS